MLFRSTPYRCSTIKSRVFETLKLPWESVIVTEYVPGDVDAAATKFKPNPSRSSTRSSNGFAPNENNLEKMMTCFDEAALPKNSSTLMLEDMVELNS